MSGQHIIIEQLRADVERLTKLHGRELLERMEAERERDEARAERDARPEITAEDAALRWKETHEGIAANAIVEAALDAHAAKAVRPNPTDCPKCGRHDGGLIAQGLAEQCSSGCFYGVKVRP